MPRVKTIQTNFTAGELSPKVRGRVDIARYQNGAEALRNVIVNIYGGAERAPGTEIVKPIKNEGQRTRLVPFIFSRDIAYTLEFGEFYMRVFRAGAGQILSGGVAYEIATPYSAAAAWQFRFTQKDDTLFISHADVPIHTILRVSETNWRLAPAPFSVLPFAETGRVIAAAGTLSAASVGTGRTLTASSATFMGSDLGRRISYGPGLGLITGVASPTVAVVQITAAFETTALPAGDWVMEDSPQAPLKPSAKGPSGATIDLSFQSITTPGVSQPVKVITGIGYASPTVTVTVAAHGYSSGDSVRIEACDPAGYNGTYIITVTGPTTFTFSKSGLNPINVLGTAQKLTQAVVTSTEGWRGDEVGQYVRINRGLVLITSVTSSTVARGVVRGELDSDVESQAGAWTLEQPVWSARHGYPTAVTINQQRLVAGGTKRDKNGLWGTRTGLYYDFTLGDEDRDAFFYALDGESNGVQHLASIRLLLALTLGTEWTLVGGVEKPLTPTNVQAKDQSVYGTTDVRPARIGDELVFVQRAGTSVLAMSYNAGTDSYKSPNLATLSEHLLSKGVVDMAYQQKPVSVLWCVCGDGTLATMTIDRDEGVIAWTQQDTAGAFESVCVIPAGDYDEVWTVVRRQVNGLTRRYVEKFTQRATTHSAIFGTDPGGKEVWTGLGHLEGLTVACVADGSKMPQMQVTGGQVTLPRKAKAVQFGLPVVPLVKPLRPEIGTPTGTAQATMMSAHKVDVLVLDTIGAQINGRPVEFRQFGADVLDKPPEPYSGWKGVGALGWEEGEMEIEISQPDPLPFHVLGIVRSWTTND